MRKRKIWCEIENSPKIADCSLKLSFYFMCVSQLWADVSRYSAKFVNVSKFCEKIINWKLGATHSSWYNHILSSAGFWKYFLFLCTFYKLYRTNSLQILFQHSLLCCLTRAESEDQDRGEDRKHNDINHERLDRVEQAFRRFDLDQDGFLSWTEFKQVKRGTSKMLMKCCFEKNYCLLHEIN